MFWKVVKLYNQQQAVLLDCELRPHPGCDVECLLRPPFIMRRLQKPPHGYTGTLTCLQVHGQGSASEVYIVEVPVRRSGSSLWTGRLRRPSASEPFRHTGPPWLCCGSKSASWTSSLTLASSMRWRRNSWRSEACDLALKFKSQCCPQCMASHT